ncbi:MAG: hypothetical protein K6E19_10180 [Lachnospiraceae bacterium]|nr:hypothetical protein [Lachnospiraceae bacterium]
MKIIECSFQGANYEIRGSYVPDEEDIIDTFEDLSVLKDGEKMTSFGETWTGSKLNKYNFLGSIIAAYFNADENVTFTFVAKEIRDRLVQTYSFSVGARKVPDKVIDPSGEMYKLIALTNTNAYYVWYDEKYDTFDGDMMIMTDMTGTTITDIPAFAQGSLLDDAEQGKEFIYVERYTKEWLDEIANKDVVSMGG